jgi:hypothetical protein
MTSPEQAEREHRSYGGYRPGSSTMGRTVVYITCPFCDTVVRAYLWSLSGSGKRCTCGAKFDAAGNAWREVAS